MELEVKLSKNSWHYKLQRFVFKEDTPDLHSLCPYFWLTIFCLPAAIFVMIYRPIKWCVKSVKESMRKAEEERLKKMFQNLTVDGAVDLIKSRKKVDGRKYKGSYDIWNLIRSWQWRKGFSDEEADKLHNEVSKKFGKYEESLRVSIELRLKKKR